MMKTFRVSFEVTIDEGINGSDPEKADQWLAEFIEDQFDHMLVDWESFSELEITELKG
jgi:hypothetical protein